MKKLYFLLFIAFATLKTSLLAQQSYIIAPSLPTTTTSVLAPNGTSMQVTQRGCFLLTAADLTVVGTNTAINSIGFVLDQGTTGPAVTGTIQVYLQNTADLNYSKGNSYSTAIAPMSSVYNSTFVIPAVFGNTIISVSLPAPFTYTGGGLYIAYDWISSGPFSNGAAIFQADNSLVVAGGANSSTAAPAGNIIPTANTRPIFQIGYINTYTNEAQVYGVLGNGVQPLINGSPYTFSVLVRNNAGVTMNNVVSTLSVSGANTFVTTTTIASIPAGGTLIASFPSYSPTAQGMSTVLVTVPSDQNNANNSGTNTQSITCNYLQAAPPVPIANFNQGVGFSTSSGLLLNRMNVPTASTLTALRLGIATYNPNAGNAVYGVVTNSSGNILAWTNTIVLTGAMFSTYQTFSFASPVAISPATDYFVGLAQPTGTAAYFPLASMPTLSNNIAPNEYATSLLGGGFIFPATPTLGVFAIESVFYNGITLTVTPVSSTICSGNPVTITASGATTYSWSNGASTSSISVTPNIYTVYTATGSAIIGTVGTCYDIQTSTVLVNITPTINCPNGAICPVGGSFTLNPTGGAVTYTYAGGGPVVTPTVTSTYTITGTSGAGCPAMPVVATVSVQPNITVSVAGSTLICNGQAAVLTASGAATYSWNTGPTTASISVSPTVNTTYSVTGVFGTCTNSAVGTLTVSPQLTVTVFATPSVICIGNSGTLIANGSTGSVSTTSFTWETGATTQSIAVSPTVNTTYTVVGVSGPCSSTAAITQSVISCVGIETHPYSTPEINIYPNPNNGVFAISITSITDNSVIELYNGLGQMIAKQKVTETNTNINLNTLGKGIYIIRLKENNLAVKTTRMIIQ